VIIKVTAVSGNLLSCDFQQRFVTTPAQNQAYSSGFLECILSMPNASSGQSIIFGGGTVRHSYCEKVDIKTIGNATNMYTMFFNCSSLQSVPLFNTINVTNMYGMFVYCYSLQSVPLFNTINVTNMEGMFVYCQSLNFIPAFVTTAVTSDFTAFAHGCHSLNRILMSFNRTVSLQSCQLSKDALVEIFTNLTNRTATTSANIDITGNWGASALTAADRLIATNKNYVITG
jgi:surface protein